MDNTHNQSIAVDAIHRISNEANMMVFMLVDEDLQMIDGGETLTQDEKHEIWEAMHEALLDRYFDLLVECVQDVIDNRDE